MRLWTATALAALVAVAAAGLAIAAGPAPGFAQEGVASRDGGLRYVATLHTNSTYVKVVRYSDYRQIRSRTIRGEYGVPQVAYDGTAGGLTHDGRLLVLESAAGPNTTRFVVLSTRTLKPQQSVTLQGTWGYDAISPDNRTLYLIQVLPSVNSIRYLVRAYDLAQHRLVPGAIADKSEPGAMSGLPMSRVESADGTWVYTLYQRTTTGGKPFIHALNAQARVAVCIDLDGWKGSATNLGSVHLTLSADETQLIVRRYTDGKALLTVDAPR
jgi:hypothetical protein